MTDKTLSILKEAKNIAVVGISDNPERASHRVALYMMDKGYRIIPVNPKYEKILGEKCYGNLSEVPVKIDIVNVFRKPEDVFAIAEEASGLDVKCFWMQLGITCGQARKILEAKDIHVVEDTCIKIFHAENLKAVE